MNRRIPIILIILSLLLVACSKGSVKENNHNESVNIKQLVEDYTVGNVDATAASITSKELIVTETDGKETVYDLPADEFFVSIAPFVDETHPCDIHSLTGCQGELANVDFDFYIEDEAGNVVVNETLNSEANGFIDLWLPRDQTYQVKVTYDGKEVESEISTFDNDGTCITTMQLM